MDLCEYSFHNVGNIWPSMDQILYGKAVVACAYNEAGMIPHKSNFVCKNQGLRWIDASHDCPTAMVKEFQKLFGFHPAR